jgi:hypothetical protein
MALQPFCAIRFPFSIFHFPFRKRDADAFENGKLEMENGKWKISVVSGGSVALP